MSDTKTYRWNKSEAAEAFDRAAEFIHPFYTTIQQRILEQLPFASEDELLLVDLGGGSGRLVERVLDRLPKAHAVLVDQSEPFLALAERRLGRFGRRAMLVECRLQDDWTARLRAAPHAIVSMSAIHHLDSDEKQRLFSRCHAALADGGIFINADEYRPESDVEYLAHLQSWGGVMNTALERGHVPRSFTAVLEAWHDRNIRRFGEPKQSGDDYHETIAAHARYLHGAGFELTNTIWSETLWAVVTSRK